MKFNEALLELSNGKYVKRPDWKNEYCCLLPDKSYIWYIEPNGVVNFMPSIADLLADDWETYNGNTGIIPPTEND